MIWDLECSVCDWTFVVGKDELARAAVDRHLEECPGPVNLVEPPIVDDDMRRRIRSFPRQRAGG